ncbi:acyltransferase family protein [Bacteroides cellulosilyticus]|uniref:acyltransferase family protein n=1 Tax=Bacteroides cellulosilyticus TaxID=246787 RepID=UPI0032C01C46
MKERFEYIDSIKGFAIFLMVMGHVIAWNYTDYKTVCIYDFKQLPNIKLGGVVWQIIYSFHMPLFFMVSGFLSYKTYNWQNFFPFLKKKDKSFVYSLAMYNLDCICVERSNRLLVSIMSF